MTHNHEVPSDDQVVAALQTIGGRADASSLLDHLVDEGHPRRQTQLAIQRAADRGRIQLERDWSYTVAKELVAA
jgi:hypothetical protein